MELYFLGTGAGTPSKQRNVSSFALLLPEYKGQIWLFDCGEGTQHQILSSPVRLSKVNRIFITHLHGDHLFGLPGVLGSRSFQGSEEPLTIYGPAGIKVFLEVTLGLSLTYLRYPLEVIEIEDGMEIIDPPFTIQIHLLDHGIPSYGFRLIEKDRPGSLQTEKLQQLGIPPGPIYGKLKKGEKVQLPDGTILDGKQFLTPPKPGKTIAIFGDTRICEQSFNVAKDADLMIHEATYRAGQEALAVTYYHSTCTQAAMLAKESNVKSLILTHLSSRFSKEDETSILQEAQSIFPHTWIAYDGFRFEIEK
jgi:ribonuclease Z